jgi:DNA-3-methyladenine glycosylase II
MDSATFNLRPVPPFRLDLTCWALRRRARNIVDRWYANSYRRVMIINGATLEVAVSQSGSRAHPVLKLERDPLSLNSGPSTSAIPRG